MIRSLPLALLALLATIAAAAPAPAPQPATAAAVAAPAAAPVPAPPAVTARAYILVDHFSGRVLAAEHADDRVEPASLTKLMTAYVVFKALQEGRLKLTDEVTISEHAWRAEGSRTFVQVGTQIPVDILIKGMIVQSGNDATIALAERVGGTEAAFAQMMNEYARRLGMKGSNFENSDGLPAPNHYTTARDMATLADALIREFPQYYPLFSLREFRGTTSARATATACSAGPLGRRLKTGHTDSAGYCLVTSAQAQRHAPGLGGAWARRAIKAREDASAALLNYGYTFFETLQPQGRAATRCSSRASTSRRPSSPPWACPTTCMPPWRAARAQACTDQRTPEPRAADRAACVPARPSAS